MKYTVQAVLPIDCRTYLVERDSAAFRSLYSRSLNLGQCEFVDSWRDGAVKYVKLATKPDFSAWVPKSARSVLPTEEMVFIDIIEYDPSLLQSPPYTLRVRSEVPFLGSWTDIHSTLTIDKAGPNATLQRREGHIKVKAWGVGGLAERMVKGSLEKTYQRLPEVVQRWVEVRKEVLQEPGGRGRLLEGRPSLSTVPWIREEVSARLAATCPAASTAPSPQLSFSVSIPALPTSRQHSNNGAAAAAASEALEEEEEEGEGNGPEMPATPVQQPSLQPMQRSRHSLPSWAVPPPPPPPPPRPQPPAPPLLQPQTEPETMRLQQAQQQLGDQPLHMASSSQPEAATAAAAAAAGEAQAAAVVRAPAELATPPGGSTQPLAHSLQIGRPPAAARTPSSADQYGVVPVGKGLSGAEEGPARPAGAEAPPQEDGSSLQVDRSWASFNSESRHWSSYWHEAGLEPLPGAPPLPPRLIRLGSFGYRMGLLRSQSAASAASLSPRAASAPGCDAPAGCPPTGVGHVPLRTASQPAAVAGARGQLSLPQQQPQQSQQAAQAVEAMQPAQEAQQAQRASGSSGGMVHGGSGSRRHLMGAASSLPGSAKEQQGSQLGQPPSRIPQCEEGGSSTEMPGPPAASTPQAQAHAGAPSSTEGSVAAQRGSLDNTTIGGWTEDYDAASTGGVSVGVRPEAPGRGASGKGKKRGRLVSAVRRCLCLS